MTTSQGVVTSGGITACCHLQHTLSVSRAAKTLPARIRFWGKNSARSHPFLGAHPPNSARSHPFLGAHPPNSARSHPFLGAHPPNLRGAEDPPSVARHKFPSAHLLSCPARPQKGRGIRVHDAHVHNVAFRRDGTLALLIDELRTHRNVLGHQVLETRKRVRMRIPDSGKYFSSTPAPVSLSLLLNPPPLLFPRSNRHTPKFSKQPSTLNPRPSTLNPVKPPYPEILQTTLNPQPSTLNPVKPPHPEILRTADSPPHHLNSRRAETPLPWLPHFTPSNRFPRPPPPGLELWGCPCCPRLFVQLHAPCALTFL